MADRRFDSVPLEGFLVANWTAFLPSTLTNVMPTSRLPPSRFSTAFQPVGVLSRFRIGCDRLLAARARSARVASRIGGVVAGVLGEVVAGVVAGNSTFCGISVDCAI